jgi:hypothetical protein
MAANDVGQVIGYYVVDSSDLNDYGKAFLWTPTTPNGTTGTLIDVDPTLGGPAYGINSSGQVTFGSAIPFSGLTVQLWTPNTPNGQVGTNSPLPYFEYHGLNDQGQVGGDGYTGNALFPGHRVGIWTPTTPNGSSGAFTFIEDLNPDGWSSFGDINAGGQVVGQYTTTVSSGSFLYGHAFVWTPSTPNGTTGVMVDIDPNPNRSSFATRINDQGDVVGFYSELTNGSYVQKPFIYHAGQFKDLNSFLPANSGIVLQAAYGLNNRGQIAALGTINGTYSAFLVSPIKTDAAVVDLEVNVNTLVFNGALLPANGQSLYAKLKSAQQKINNGDNAGAITDLNAFINQVKAFIKTGKLSQSDGQALIDAANAIIQYLKA